MYYISDYKKQAIDKIIPYLIEFPQIVKIIEQSADRYQAIEDVLWKIADNFKIDNARGVFLQALAHNEVTNIIYTDKAKDAFTYGTTQPLYQAYGTGHYYSQSSYISGIQKDVTDEKTIRAVKAKIIQNNTNCTTEDFIKCMKLLFNIEQVKIFETYPFNISLMLVGKKIELSSSGNQDIIKKVMPVCTSLKNLWVDSKQFDVFQYNDTVSYGDSRYPILVGDTTNIFTYISQSVTLDSQFKEYITPNLEKFDENKYFCICGAFTKLNPNATLFSTSNINENMFVRFKLDDDLKFVVETNDGIYKSDIQATLNQRYTFLINNSNGIFKTWIIPNINIFGKELEYDVSFCKNRIQFTTPSIEVTNYTTINAPVYINCVNNIDEQSDFGDFTYYAIMIGDTTNKDNEFVQYYVSCYGEKQILFNCNGNNNHLQIHTNNPLVSNIMTRQHYYNYKATHSGSRYLYMDGKSGISYNINNEILPYNINNIDISFETCMPINISDGNIITDFISDKESESKIYFDLDGRLNIDLPMIIQVESDIDSGTLVDKDIVYTYSTPQPIISHDEYAYFNILIHNKDITFYKNNKIVHTASFDGTISDIPKTLRIGYNKEVSNPFKGFLKNVIIKISGTDTDNTIKVFDISLPFKTTLEDMDKKYEYINYGARFITTPQLISDTTNLDLYGNKLISTR